jgi:hypothetical protein
MSLSLYTILGDSFIIYAKKIKNGDINTTVIDEETNCTVFCETGHPAAWESLVYFAQQILNENKKIEQGDIQE